MKDLRAQSPRRVFLSHTAEFREWPDPSFIAATERAVLRSGDAVTDMKYFTAQSEYPAHYCQKRVEEADIYVGVIGFRYGSSVLDRPEMSYTELEYYTAAQYDIPRLIFILDEKATVPVAPFSDNMHGHRQRVFRARLQATDTVVQYFTTAEQLEILVFQALVETATGGENRANRAGPGLRGAANRPPHDGGRIVDRPNLIAKVVGLVCGDIHTELPRVVCLEGPGGFGKTTTAAMLSSHPLVQERYPDGLLWVTIGRTASALDLLSKLNDLALFLSGIRPNYNNIELASQHLGRLLADTRHLLVVDDVWSIDQLSPFLVGGAGCARLITTRRRDLVPTSGRVAVEGMDPDEALEIVREGIEVRTARPALATLASKAGGWPLLLRLSNSSLRRYLSVGLALEDAADRVTTALEANSSPTSDLSEVGGASISASISASLDFLREVNSSFVDRYRELAIFPDDVDIPLTCVGRYWFYRGGIQQDDVENLAVLLYDLSLIQNLDLTSYTLRLHTVLARHLQKMTESDLKEMHKRLVDSSRDLVPSVDGKSLWWQLDSSERYLWEHLVVHLSASGTPAAHRERDTLVSDLHWVERKGDLLGLTAVEIDLEASSGHTVTALRSRLAQASHLLRTPDAMPRLGASLLARLSHEPLLEEAVSSYSSTLGLPWFRPVWPLPDQKHPSPVRVLTGHKGPVTCVGLFAHSGKIISGSRDGAVRVWNPDGTSGGVLCEQNASIAALEVGDDWIAVGHADGVTVWSTAGEAVAHFDSAGGSVSALALTGGRLAVAYWDGSLEYWDVLSGSRLVRVPASDRVYLSIALSGDGNQLVGGTNDGAIVSWDMTDPSTPIRTSQVIKHVGAVNALALSIDGEQLVSGGWDGSVKAWDNKDRELPSILLRHPGPVHAIRLSSDGKWLATGGSHGTVAVTGPPPNRILKWFAGHTGDVQTCMFGPDARWLVTGGSDGTVRIWRDPASTGKSTDVELSEPVECVVSAPDGETVVTGGRSGLVRVRARSGRLLATLRGHTGPVCAAAFTRLADTFITGSWDCTARIWSRADMRSVRVLGGHGDIVSAVDASLEDGRFVTGCRDGSVRLWDRRSVDTRLSGHVGGVSALKVSTDASFIAAGCADGRVLLWSLNGEMEAVLSGHSGGVSALTVAPDGSVIVGSRNGTVRLWERDGRPGPVYAISAHDITAIDLCCDGKRIVTTSRDGVVRVIERSTGTHIAALRMEGLSGACAWVPGSNHLLVGSDSGLALLQLVLP